MYKNFVGVKHVQVQIISFSKPMSLQNVFNILGPNHLVQVSSLMRVFSGCHYKRLWNEDSTTSCNEHSFLNKHTVGEFNNELCPVIALFICTHRLLCFSTLIYANQVTAWNAPQTFTAE